MVAMPLSAPPIPPAAAAIMSLAAATDRLLATIDAMPAAAFAARSVLPGWSRGHVLAHLALNSKALTGVLTTLGQPDPLTMYVSAERRDSDIEHLAAQPAARIADRVAVGAAMLAAHLGGGPSPDEALEAVGRAGQDGSHRAADDRSVTGAFARAATDAAAAVADWTAAGTFDRVPGGPALLAADIPYMRWREVEIHHADLGLGYGPADWEPEFARYLFDAAAYDRDGEAAMTVSAAGGPSYELGDAGPGTMAGPAGSGAAGPNIRGTAADLAWWLVGRGAGEGLTVDDRDLPRLGPWHHRG